MNVLQTFCILGTSLATETIFDVNLKTLSTPPLWEPTLEEYFANQPGRELRDENGLASPVVLTSPSNEEFFRHARKGYPIVITDWGKDMQYDGWSGKDFATNFPFGYMKAEYIQDMPGYNPKHHDVRMMDGEARFNLGSFKPDKTTMWHNYSRPASKRYADDPLKPKTGPYVWHVKDELPPKEKKLVQQRFEAPPFLQDQLNKDWMNRTFELWFSPGSRAGAGAHNDGYCESVVSLQLRGDKKWRKMMMPEMSVLDSFDEFDGGVYTAGRWQPDLGFLNKRQSAVIWPPGYLHETSTLQPEDGECGAALTLQYAFPQPVQFFRAFLPRLSLSSEVGQCVARAWSGYPTFYVPGIEPTSKAAVMEEQLKRILKAVDKDGNDLITVEETKSWLAGSNSDAVGERDGYKKNMRNYFVHFKAEDTIAYHDLDDDMTASKQEIWESLVQWNVVRIRIQHSLELANVADREGLEAFERSLDYLRRKPVLLPEKLREEMEMLFTLPKGTKVLKSLRGINSFSDSEWYESTRDRIEKLYRKHKKKRQQTDL